MSSFGILDINGFMFSGKTAVSDLIREFEGIGFSHYQDEFDLIRMPNGLGDLMRAFQTGSLISIDHAIRSYRKLTSNIALPPKGLKRLVKYGGNYETRYPGFLASTEIFLQAISGPSWKIKWPYNADSLSPLSILSSKIFSKINGGENWPTINFHLGEINSFFPAVKIYLNDILRRDSGPEISWQLTHNALEPYNPSQYYPLFESVKAIVVNRDVRDIYMTANSYSQEFNDQVSMYKRISGAHDINIFIQKQKAMHYPNAQSTLNTLSINFEDLVENYETSISLLIKFLDLSKSSHTKPFLFFNPENSKKNIGLWKNATKAQISDIKKLEAALPHLCHR